MFERREQGEEKEELTCFVGLEDSSEMKRLFGKRSLHRLRKTRNWPVQQWRFIRCIWGPAADSNFVRLKILLWKVWKTQRTFTACMGSHAYLIPYCIHSCYCQCSGHRGR